MRAAATSGGWFPTRDEGHLDDDGYLFVHGRLDDVIVRGGENLSPGVIEDALRSHPAVSDAAVVGLPDNRWGEQVAAAVVLRSPEKDSAILAYCREHLADFKCPKKIYIVDQIPRTATGKIQRGAVAASFASVQTAGKMGDKK